MSEMPLETRVLYLEKLLVAEKKLNTLLFKLIITSDPPLQARVAEALRLLLINPNANLSPDLSLQIASMRALLIEPIPEEVEKAAQAPHLRPVD